MNWNCPHCSVLVSLNIDIEKKKSAYVRCDACGGVARLSKKVVTPPPFRTLPQSLTESADTLAATARTHEKGQEAREQFETQADQHAQEKQMAQLQVQNQGPIEIENYFAGLPPAAPSPPPMEIQMDARLETSIDPAGAVIVRNTTPIPAFLAQGAPKREDDEKFEENEPVLNTEKSEPSASAHQFEFREVRGPALVRSTEPQPVEDDEPALTPGGAEPEPDPSRKVLHFPKPPEFLTRQNELIEEAIKVVTEKIGPKRSRRSMTFAVAIAAIVAILSGLYLFVQGQKLLQESRHVTQKTIRFSQQDIADQVASGANAPVRLMNPPPLRIQVKVPRAILRAGPDVAAAAAGVSEANTTLEVRGWEGTWFRVSVPGTGREAWIRNDLVRKL